MLRIYSAYDRHLSGWEKLVSFCILQNMTRLLSFMVSINVIIVVADSVVVAMLDLERKKIKLTTGGCQKFINL